MVIAISLLLFSLIIWASIRTPYVQSWLVKQVTNYAATELKTSIQIGAIDADLFNHLILRNIVVIDQKKDTLLYAGVLKVYLSDVLFMSKSATLSAIRLEKVRINCSRQLNDSTFNYQFILDGLKSTDTTPSKNPWKLAFKKIYLSDVALDYNDAYSNHINSSINQLVVDFKSTDLLKKEIRINDLHINGASVCITPYAATGVKQFKTEPATPAIKSFNPANWLIGLRNFEISSSSMTYNQLKIDSNQEAIYEPLDLTQIAVQLSNLKLKKDTLDGQLNTIKLKEGKGFELTEMSTHFSINTEQLNLSDFIVQTPNSSINSQFTFDYSELADLNNFIENVRFKALFKESKIGVEDVRYFTKLPTAFKDALVIDGTLTGSVTNLRGANLTLSMGSNLFKGKFKLKGLPDIKNTFIDFTTESLISNGANVLSFLPETQNPDLLKRIGGIAFQGNFSGFISDFVAQGNLQTDLGNLSSDVNLKTTEGNLSYSGSISSDRFNIGKLTNRTAQLGELTFSAEVNGQGWLNKNPKVTIKGLIEDLDANQYHYRNVNLNGVLTKNEFSGAVVSSDPNADFTFNGAVIFGDAVPEFNFNSVIHHIDFKNLNLSKEHYEISNSTVNLKASGNTIDNFTGRVLIKNMELKLNNRIAKVENFECTSLNQKFGKHFTINSNFLNASIDGQFNYEQLPQAFTHYLHEYFPTYIPVSNSKEEYYKAQQFAFELEVKEDAELVKLFIPEIKSFANFKIKGDFNTQNQSFNLNGKLPNLNYNTIRIEDMAFTTQSTKNALISGIKCSSIYSNDSLLVQRPNIAIYAHHDSLSYSITTKKDTNNTYVDLHGFVLTDTNTVITHLTESAIYLQHKKWLIDPQNQIVFKQGVFALNHLEFTNELQSIRLSSFEEDHEPSNLRVIMNNVSIGHLSKFALKKKDSPQLSGELNGTVELRNIFNHLVANVQLELSHFVVDRDSLGFLSASINYDDSIKHINTEFSVQNNYSQFSATGYYNLKDSVQALHYSVNLNTFNLRYIEPLIPDILSHKRGIISGAVQVSGSLKKPIIATDCQISYGSVRINYLGTSYQFKHIHLKGANSILTIDPFEITDSLNNSATFVGNINLQNLKGVLLDFKIDTKNLLVLNTNYEQNHLFYGKAFAGGVITLKGITYNLVMTATATTNKGTSIYIPIADDQDVTQHDFVQFISSSKQKTDKPKSSYKENLDGVTIDFDISTTPDAEIILLMDLAAGDYVKARGTGNIKMQFSTISALEMFGDYTIRQGDYYFTFLNTVNKEFNITKGTIVWNGNPYNATVDITASYPTRAAFYDLLSETLTSNEEILSAKKLVPVNVEMKASGSLIKPAINFDLLTPNTNGNSQVNFLALQKLQKIKEDQNELNNQVFGLMVLNRFLPTSNTADASNPFNSVYKNTLTELASIQVSKRINDAFYRITKDDKTQINLNYRLYDAATDVRNYNEWNVNVSRRFFNDRLTIDGGFVYDYGKTETTNTTNLAGDFLVEYKLTLDGRVKLKGFKKTEYDILSERNKNRTGLGLSYRREFNTFEELWNAVLKKK